ncbi:hypothetical protein MCBB_2315 [Methanobacterium congolense]|uniref:Uncharacterized protein n=1 Tax=Methanobacterium congolense TaxID=118062 RepID=A0A1D3L5F4_9EURY|nr:hypothetical protein MCBB_2315 [Methanobacterium congolense]
MVLNQYTLIEAALKKIKKITIATVTPLIRYIPFLVMISTGDIQLITSGESTKVWNNNPMKIREIQHGKTPNSGYTTN